MKKQFLTFALVASMFAFAACSDKKDSAERAEDQNEETIENTTGTNTAENAAEEASEFWIEAATGSMKEIEMAKLAEMKSNNAEIKSFAQTLITDHTKIQEEVTQAASKNNLTVPTTLDKDAQDKYDKLNKKTGAEFDKKWIECMVKDHEKEVKAYQDEMNNSKNTMVRDWATNTLPILQKHLERARTIEASMKK